MRTFLTHASADTDAVHQLAAEMIAAGSSTPSTHAQEMGNEWADEDDQAFSRCDWVVVLLSPAGLVSPRVWDGWNISIKRRKRILVVKLRACVLPRALGTSLVLDLTGPMPVTPGARIVRCQQWDLIRKNSSTDAEFWHVLALAPKLAEYYVHPSEKSAAKRRRSVTALGSRASTSIYQTRDAFSYLMMSPEDISNLPPWQRIPKSPDGARLFRCLQLGGQEGRDQWNYFRAMGEVQLEAIEEPLSVEMSDGVRIPLEAPNLWLENLENADLAGYDLSGINMSGAILDGANLTEADLSGAIMMVASIRGADLCRGDLSRTNLLDADLRNSDLTGSILVGAQLLRTNIAGAILDGCNIHGTAVWGTKGEPKSQRDLKITTPTEPIITVDDIEVGQFIYLMLNNSKVRNVLQTITSKVVLILGRFSEERKIVLDRLRDALRDQNLSPILFDFDAAGNLDISDTVTLLARMARFVIADLTDPRSVQQELTMIAPNVMVAICPIIIRGQKPWSMFSDLQRRSRGLLPIYEYIDGTDLIRNLKVQVLGPLETRRLELLPLQPSR